MPLQSNARNATTLQAPPPGSPAASAQTDAQLLAATADGCAQAFSELYDRYRSRAYRAAWVVCRDHEGTQDAVQEAFASIWRTTTGYETDRGSVSTWLMTVVRHRAIDLARRHTSIVARLRPVPLEDRQGRDDVVEQAMSHERSNRCATLLLALPETQREVIALSYYGELTQAEIAQHLKLPPGTVKSRVRLGLNKLRATALTADL